MTRARILVLLAINAPACGGDPFVFIGFPEYVEGGTEVLAIQKNGQTTVHAAALSPALRFPETIDRENDRVHLEALIYAEPIATLPFVAGAITSLGDGAPLPAPTRGAFALELEKEEGEWRVIDWPTPILGEVRIDRGCRTFSILEMSSIEAPMRILDAIAYDATTALLTAFDDDRLVNAMFFVRASGIQPVSVEVTSMPVQQIRTMALQDDLWIGDGGGGLWKSEPSIPLDFVGKHQLDRTDAISDLAIAGVADAFEVFVASRLGLSKFVSALAPLRTFRPEMSDRRVVVRLGADRVIAFSATELVRYDAGASTTEALASAVLSATSVEGLGVVAVTEAGEIVLIGTGENTVEVIEPASGVAIHSVVASTGGYLIGDSAGLLREYRGRDAACEPFPVFGGDVIKRMITIDGTLLLFGAHGIARVAM